MSCEITAQKKMSLFTTPWLFLFLLGLCLAWVKISMGQGLNLKEYSPLSALLKTNTSYYDPFTASMTGINTLPIANFPSKKKSATEIAIYRDKWAYSKEVKLAFKKAIKNGRYHYVLKKTNDMKLPAHLALIPLLESDYKDHIVSSSGAAGAWQLSAEIARDYGLKRKQRFDFKPSTIAALKFLKQLHKQFGTWELAMAAYNAGPGRVAGALRKNPAANSINELALPRETKLYVARIKQMEQQFQAVV